MVMQANNPVKALYTMEEIIETLEEHKAVGVTELAEIVERPQSVVHNHLATLRELEYVIKEESKYKLGLKFLQRGEIVRKRLPLYAKGAPAVRKLAKETKELITLIVEEHGRGVYLDVAQDNADIQYPAIPGTRIRLHCSATGKAIMAYMSEDKVEEIINRHGLPAQTDKTITTRDELYEELDAIRERGYAYDRQEFREGMRSIGAPILDESNNILGGLSIAGPTHRFAGDRLETELPKKLLQSVNVIELNYNEPNIQ
ncbi:IclR family transcriptional regulator [Haladaptatus halobius]|uniref:IclR family transcriptional regulator n=1 Tax=Haladaptatus halobius TaxID=2884875 RepID=UPI001D0A087D|nr:IclR family transcriptional regulator [Haladaptatus halobius]